MKANTQRGERLECEDTNEIHNYQTKNFKGSLEQQLGFSKNSNWRKSYRLTKTIRVINRLRKMKSVERISYIHKIELFSRGEVR